MAKTIKYGNHDIRLCSRRVGTAYPWGKEYEKQHHKISVSVGVTEAQFSYYCNERRLKAEDLVLAFYYFLGDGVSYDNARNIDDFNSEFGYEKVSDCIKAYNGCFKAWVKWKCFGIDPYELSNWLQEKYDL